MFGAYGIANPNPSANKASDYQASLSSMMTMMSDLNKTSPLVVETVPPTVRIVVTPTKQPKWGKRRQPWHNTV